MCTLPIMLIYLLLARVASISHSSHGQITSDREIQCPVLSFNNYKSRILVYNAQEMLSHLHLHIDTYDRLILPKITRLMNLSASLKEGLYIISNFV